MPLFGQPLAPYVAPSILTSPIATEALPTAPVFAPLPQKRSAFGGFGKALSTIGDILAYGPLAGSVHRAQERSDVRRASDLEDAEVERAYRRAVTAKADRDATMPTYTNVGGVGLARINPDGSDPSVVIPEVQRDPEVIRIARAVYGDVTSPAAQRYIERASRGYQYTPEGVAAQAQVAEARAASNAAHRAPPRASTAAPKYAIGADGKVRKWVP